MATSPSGHGPHSPRPHSLCFKALQLRCVYSAPHKGLKNFEAWPEAGQLDGCAGQIWLLVHLIMPTVWEKQVCRQLTFAGIIYDLSQKSVCT